MAYEVFKLKGQRRGYRLKPLVTLRSQQFYLNRTAVDLFPAGRPKYVDILRDPATGQIALRPVDSGENSYSVVNGGGVGAAMIEATVFVRQYNYQVPLFFTPVFDTELNALVLE